MKLDSCAGRLFSSFGLSSDRSCGNAFGRPWPAGARPRAAASNSARCGPVRPSAPASSRAVSWRAVRFTPRSRSLTDRGDRLAASASSSWVSPASSRSRRSSPAKLSAGCSATGLSPLTKPRPPLTWEAGHSTGPCQPAYKRAGSTPSVTRLTAPAAGARPATADGPVPGVAARLRPKSQHRLRPCSARVPAA